MALASFEDANEWLDENKIQFLNEDDARQEANNADNIVRSWLAGNWPEYVNLWAHNAGLADNVTPAVVKEAASLLMASYRYAKRYSEESFAGSDYAQRLERRAVEMLAQLKQGELVLWDKTYGQDIFSTYSIEPGDFFPNGDSEVLCHTPGSMDMCACGYYDDGCICFPAARKFSMDTSF